MVGANYNVLIVGKNTALEGLPLVVRGLVKKDPAAGGVEVFGAGKVGGDEVLKHADKTFDVVLVDSAEVEGGILGDLHNKSKPGAAVHFFNATNEAKAAGIKSELVLAGFVEASVSSEGGAVVVSAKKPDWEVGASAPLKLNFKKPAVAAEIKSVVWNVSGDDDGELEDEDSLLTEDDKKRPANLKVKDDCEVGKGGARKACKNCTCGRAELEANPVKIDAGADLTEFKSSCGNCYLGDAFRCAGCPQRGKPAYKPGEEVSLDLSSDDI